MLPGLPNGGFKVGLVARQNCRHLFNILGSLGFQDLESVVDGYKTNQALFLIHNGERDDTVVRDHVGDLFSVVVCGGIQNVLVHNVANEILRIGKQELLEHNNAFEHALLVGDVGNVDRLFVKTNAANARDRFFTSHILAQVDKLAGHYATRTFLGVGKEAVDLLTRLRSGVFHNAFNHVCGHFLKHINGVVGVKLFKHFTNLAVGHVHNDQLLQIGVQLGKYLCSNIFFEKTEHAGYLILGEEGDQVSGVNGVAFVNFLYKFSISLLQEQFLQGFKFQNIGFGHCLHLLLGERRKQGSYVLPERALSVF